MLSVRQRLNLIAVAIGLFGCYSVFGILQERIFRKGYSNGAEQESDKFTYPVTFVCLQCVYYSIFAKGKYSERYIELEIKLSFNLLVQWFCWPMITRRIKRLKASSLSLRAFTSWRWLRRIRHFSSFPTRVRLSGKVRKIRLSSQSFLTVRWLILALKPIPTMIFGCVVGGKYYTVQKYLCVLLIVSGAILFLYKSDQQTYDNSVLGYGLVCISLLMNGFMAGVQEKMRSVARPSPLNLMLFLNSWSSVFVIIAVIASGEIKGFIGFCIKHPEVLIQIGLILIVGGFGQYFACTMITNYGCVPCCITLTIRKFFNVLFSVLYFGNALSIRQWLGTAIIFTALFADSIFNMKYRKIDKTEIDCKLSGNNVEGKERTEVCAERLAEGAKKDNAIVSVKPEVRLNLVEVKS